jgi:hypothetical protein
MKLVFRTLFTVAAAAAVASAFAQTPPSTPAQTRPSTFNVPSNWGSEGAMRNGNWTPSMPDSQMAMRRKGIVAQVQPVPEPSQWALMAAGVGLVGWIVRRRSKRNQD